MQPILTGDRSHLETIISGEIQSTQHNVGALVCEAGIYEGNSYGEDHLKERT